MANHNLFRKKALDMKRGTEKLDDILREDNPRAWMFILAAVLLLTGFCVWGIFGHIESRTPAAAVSDGTQLVCYVYEADAAKIKAGMEAEIGDGLYTLTGDCGTPVQAGRVLDDYGLHIGGFDTEDWICAAELTGSLPAGSYKASVITERTRPVSFVTN